MNIEDSCPCGAAFEVEDRSSVMAASRHIDWLKAHATCRTRKPARPVTPATYSRRYRQGARR